MSWFLDWVERMVGLDPNKIDPAFRAIGPAIAAVKRLEPNGFKLKDIYYNEVAPILKDMQPDINVVEAQVKVIQPAVDQVMHLFGVQVSAGVAPAKATDNISRAAGLAHPELDVSWIQKALKRLGYDPGVIDGVNGIETIRAVKRYQITKRLTVDGWPGPETVSSLQYDLNRLDGVSR